MDNNSIKRVLHEDCTGCSACATVCPRQCIVMRFDAMGFPYPEVEDDKCILCGLCLKTCKTNYKQKNSNHYLAQEIYAARNKEMSVVEASASGGVFTALSNSILNDGGIIVGAVFADNGMTVHHAFAESIEQRDRMRGSKYTYSHCSVEIFRKVKDYLLSGRKVFFTGTPCQVAALKSSLENNYPNLITCDLLCHGVESPAVYRDYIKEMSKRGEIDHIDFRHPMYDNWHEAKTIVHYVNKSTKNGNWARAYYMLFVQDLGLRPSCYKCQYCTFERCGDITIGDFHGIENTPIRTFDHSQGCSVVLVNTEEGRSLFSQSSNSLFLVKAEKSYCSHHQLNGLPTADDKKWFEQEYLKKGYRYVAKKYGMPSLKIRILQSMYAHPWIWKLKNRVRLL